MDTLHLMVRRYVFFAWLATLAISASPLAIAGTPNGGPRVDLESVVAFAGGTRNQLLVDYTDGGNGARSIEFQLIYTGSSTLVGCQGLFTRCEAIAPGRVSFSFEPGGRIPSGTLAALVFDSSGAEQGSTDPVSVDPSTARYVDASDGSTRRLDSSDGRLNLVQGLFTFYDLEPDQLAISNGVGVAPRSENVAIVSAGGDQAEPIELECGLGVVLSNGITAETQRVTARVDVVTELPISCAGSALGPAGVAVFSCSPVGQSNAYLVNRLALVWCDINNAIPAPVPAAGSTIELDFGAVARGGSTTERTEFTTLSRDGGTFDVSCDVVDSANGAYAIAGNPDATVSFGNPEQIAITAIAPSTGPAPIGQMDCT